MGADGRFLALTDEIPPPLQIPSDFSFVTARRAERLVWLAGHSPNLRKRPPEFDFVGKVGRDLSRQEGYDAARLVGLNLLVTLRSMIGSLDRVDCILQVVGAVNSAPDFVEQATVLNGCTDLLVEVFDDAGRPTRMAYGASGLPYNMALEALMVAQLRPDAEHPA